MRSYTLEIDPEQLVFWTRAELAQKPSRLKTWASCGREVRTFDKRPEFLIGDAEEEDLSEIATVASLEIRPGSEKEGWSISVLVEDEPGLSISDQDVEDGEDEIDLETFYDTFLLPGRGTVYVTATVRDAAAQARATRFLGDVLNDRHRVSPARQRP
ncbi:hypothetical protein [Roseibium salinum]|uniref:SRPBCC family protein n=1 Tax=Roseibium salinum TaxID=1604349 RepID=A0ABT3R8N4_9HYPH|nr:hypothetical protein [Roseibium sp. DSM 29163]MCX2725676.1 hypothetical protein [Roseibium sp. DSM 29163]MDN3720567.1 hypothetical protein [Roseibium salinum]